jgi:hypothetical protein
MFFDLRLFSRREILRLISLASASAVFPYGKASSFASEPGHDMQEGLREEGAARLEGATDGVLTLAPPLTGEEKEIARYLADKIKHEIAVAASMPLTESFPRGSHAELFQKYLMNKDRKVRDESRKKAQKILSAPMQEQRKTFGDFASKNATDYKKPSMAEDKILENKLRAVIKKRLPERVNPDLRLHTHKDTLFLTTLEAGDFDGDIVRSQRIWHIHEPLTMEFLWKTQLTEATHARWEMQYFQRSGRFGVTRHATGEAGKAPSARFDIDLSQHLPETPPDSPITLKVRVQPIKRFSGSLDSQAVGDPSNWVEITYMKQAEGQTQFDEEMARPPYHYSFLYKRLEFMVKKIKCVEETGEDSASDEILLGGLYTLPNGRVYKMRTRLEEYFDKDDVVNYNPPDTYAHLKFWNLPSNEPENLLAKEPTDAPGPFPRTYLFTLIMGEEDPSGGFDYYVELVLDALIKAVAGLAKNVPIVGQVIAWAIVEVYELFKSLFEDPDDFMMEKTYVLTLNGIDDTYIHSLPGTVVNLPDGRTEFHSKPGTFKFVGGSDSDGGEYDVEVLWKVTQ